MGILGETVYLMIRDDNLVEGNETVSLMLVLNINSSLVIVANGTIDVIIVDDDGELVKLKSVLYPINT